VKDPQSEAPVAYKCATSPISSMPDYTMPCLTNWGGRVGEEVDMCIEQNRLDQRPDYTMVGGTLTARGIALTSRLALKRCKAASEFSADQVS
jgi:hypothetical protein